MVLIQLGAIKPLQKKMTSQNVNKRVKWSEPCGKHNWNRPFMGFLCIYFINIFSFLIAPTDRTFSCHQWIFRSQVVVLNDIRSCIDARETMIMSTCLDNDYLILLNLINYSALPLQPPAAAHVVSHCQTLCRCMDSSFLFSPLKRKYNYYDEKTGELMSLC